MEAVTQLHRSPDEDLGEISVPECLDSENTNEMSKCRKLCIALACAIINACNAVILTAASGCQDAMVNDIGYTNVTTKGIFGIRIVTKESNGRVEAIYEALSEFSPLAAPITVVVIVFIGCRVTAVIGCILIAIGFLLASFLDNHVLVGILVAGVAGLGMSFLQLSSVIKLLETFKMRRLIAVICYNLLAVVAIVFTTLRFIFAARVNWRVVFRWQCAAASVAILASLFLGKSKYNKAQYRKLFKKCLLYVVLLIVFFDTVGRWIPDTYLLDMAGALDEGEDNKVLSFIFEWINKGFLLVYQCIAQFVGLLFLFCWNCLKKKGLTAVLLVIGIVNLLVGVSSCITPSIMMLEGLLAYAVFIGFSKSFIRPLLDDNVPDSFGEENIKIVEGLFSFSTGIATLISGPLAEAVEKHEKSTFGSVKMYLVLYVAGGAFIVSAITALFTACNVASPENNTNPDGTVDSNNVASPENNTNPDASVGSDGDTCTVASPENNTNADASIGSDGDICNVPSPENNDVSVGSAGYTETTV